MATGTYFVETQDILNKVWNPAGTGPSPTGDSISVYLLAGSGQNTPVLGSGTSQTTGQGPLLVSQPAFRQFVLDSTTTSSTTGTTTGTTTTGLGGYRIVTIEINVATVTGTVSTLDIFVDSRLDGTNYLNLAHIIYTSATASAFVDVIQLRKDAYSSSTLAGGGALITNIGADAGAGAIRSIGWGDDLRIRRTTTTGTTAPIYTYTVTVNALS